MFDIVALGELLIDFTYHGRSENGMRLFEQNPGGAPANMLCAASNLGSSTAFIGKVGRDMHGDYLRRVLEEKGVDTGGLISAEDVFTTLAFVELSETGERKFSFARKPGADTCLTACEVKRELLEGCRIFHFGSLSLTDEPSRSATIEAVKAAKKAGAIISYDPNYLAPFFTFLLTILAFQLLASLLEIFIIGIHFNGITVIVYEVAPSLLLNFLLYIGLQPLLEKVYL